MQVVLDLVALQQHLSPRQVEFTKYDQNVVLHNRSLNPGSNKYGVEVTSLEVRCLDWVVEIVKDIAVWHTCCTNTCETLVLLLVTLVDELFI